MKKLLQVSIIYFFLIALPIYTYTQEIEVLYTLDYKVKKIIPSNGYHACITDNETTHDGIFDIYDIDGNFIASKEFLKGNYTANPSVNMQYAIIQEPNISLASGVIDTETSGYWTAFRKYGVANSPEIEKIMYNIICEPFVINGAYYGVFYVFENYDILSTGYSFPYSGSGMDIFISPLDNDLNTSWVYAVKDDYPTVSTVYNLQTMPNGNLLLSINGDFSPPFDSSSKAIEIDSTTGEYVGFLAEGMSGNWDMHRYDYTTGDLYVYHDDIWTINRYDNNGDLLNNTDWQPNPMRLFNNKLTNIQFVNDEVVGINLQEYGQTTHLSKDLIQGYTTPSFNFNSNFWINSGWMNEDGSQILLAIYTGDGMQIGSTTLPNITDWNTIVCQMTNSEPLELRGILNDTDENIVTVFDHQIYDGSQWIDGYYQSTLVFKNNAVPDVGDPVDNWFEAAPGMEIYLGGNHVGEYTRNGETFKGLRVRFKKTGATGVDLVEVAMEVIIKSAEEVGIGVEDYINNEIVKVFPNPVKSILTIENQNEKAEVQLYNTLGQLVLSQECSKEKNTINVCQLNTGYYFLKINNNKGIVTKKIIKE